MEVPVDLDSCVQHELYEEAFGKQFMENAKQNLLSGLLFTGESWGDVSLNQLNDKDDVAVVKAT